MLISIEQLANNTLLIASSLISLLIIILFRKVNKQHIDTKKFQQNMNYPYRQFREMVKGKFRVSKFFMLVLVLLFMSVSFMFLYIQFGVIQAVLLFIPIAVVVAFLFTEIIWILSFAIRKLIALENFKMNTIFSLVIVMLILVFVNLTFNNTPLSEYTFYLAIYNLLFSYALIVYLLLQLLCETKAKDRTLTFKNLWKSTFLIIFLFLTVLSGLSYVTYMYDTTSFSGTNINTFFDIFYYTCVTFASVGYGDIMPVSFFARVICVLTITTSIICITVLLSTVMSVKNKDD